MRQYTATFIILTITITQVFGQTDSSSVYGELETKKFYSVGLSSEITDGNGTYYVNENKVSKFKYEKYESTRRNMENCCPCILKSYDENEVLLREAVSCTDCMVGYYKEFYPNGVVKLHAHYKENPTGNWDNIWDRGYCNIRDGQWTYFNEKGDTLYSEFWKNGEFIKQVPEQKTNEIWKIELTLNGESVNKTLLTPEQVKQLVMTPKYKNSSTVHSNFTLELQVSAIGYKPIKKSFTMESFKNIDVMKIISEAGIPSDKQIYFTLLVYNNNKNIANFSLEIIH